VHDYYALAWPAWLPSGVYGLEVGVFPHFAADAVPVDSGSAAWHSLGDLAIASPTGERLPNRHAVLMTAPAEPGDASTNLWLVGSRAPGEVAAGSPLDLDLAWVCHGGETQGLNPAVWWVDTETGMAFAQGLVARGEPGIGLSCSGTHAGTTIRRYPLTAPDRPGRYRLEIGLEDGGADQGALARCDWLRRVQARCPLATVEVGVAGTGLATYAGRVLLLEASLDAEGVVAGGPLYTTLRWRALETMTHDYTVFVQVIGPDGQVYGQADSWPGQGGRPTSGWRAGEEVADSHSFYVHLDGPPGEYRVIVGLYLLADMSRLPVIDAAGNAISDFHEAGSFYLP
jgi:hypothetical protein